MSLHYEHMAHLKVRSKFSIKKRKCDLCHAPIFCEKYYSTKLNNINAIGKCCAYDTNEAEHIIKKEWELIKPKAPHLRVLTQGNKYEK